MKYAGINKNDVLNSDSGVNVSVWFQGCPHRCPSCFNPETWDPNGGEEIEYQDFLTQILKAISANGINRGLSLLGGDPLAPYNHDLARQLCADVRQVYPSIKIYLWTGYLFKDVSDDIKELVDVIIDGPFIFKKKDLTLALRGSSNQHIWRKQNNNWECTE